MRKTRKCVFCGKEFTCNSGSQRYCSEHCAEAAKAQRKKRQQDFLKAVQPVIDIASQEYLSLFYFVIHTTYFSTRIYQPGSARILQVVPLQKHYHYVPIY